MAPLTEEQQKEYYFLSLEEILQALAMPPEIQLTLVADGAAKADELADDFDTAYMMNSSGRRWHITPEQVDVLSRIDAAFEEMSGPNPLWTEEALMTAEEWNNIRSLAADALRVFGWELEAPDWTHTYTYDADGRMRSSTTISARHQEFIRKWEQADS